MGILENMEIIQEINMYKTIDEFITNELGKSGVSIKNTIKQAYELGVQHGGNTIISQALSTVDPTIEETQEEARERLVAAIIENVPEDEEDLDSEDDGIG